MGGSIKVIHRHREEFEFFAGAVQADCNTGPRETLTVVGANAASKLMEPRRRCL
jgi:hypothetical protein